MKQKNKGGMPISLKDYGRNQKERKEDIHQSGLLITGVDVNKVKHKDFRLPVTSRTPQLL